ncbi:MAG: antibiotic biosynthesis monooxygenase [Syntrophobacteraceae bacterium]|jgi:heme-degrading monooxygenase HmoA|nr:antibiotic biosynthesis monooxygenase [Syntrophobacteraceae bacterium]
MAIKVIIERKSVPGNDLELNRVLMELRARAMKVKGYISGETLRELDEPNTCIVISTWSTLDDWKAWEGNAERVELQKKIDALLRAPSRHRVLVYY